MYKSHRQTVLTTSVILAYLLTSIPLVADESQSIQYKGSHLVITGTMDWVFVNRIKAAYQIAPKTLSDSGDTINSITTFEITSPGGEIEPSISLGEFIFNNQLSVYLPDICLSSCANYLFTAGKTKILNEDTVLGWHGGAEQQSFLTDIQSISDPNLRQQQLTWLTNLRQKEHDFFQLIGVDQKICTLGQSEPYNIEGFWDYSIDDLKSFGITHIKYKKTLLDTPNKVRKKSFPRISV